MLVGKEKLNSITMVFILARGRSGSSLLSKIMNESENIVTAPEALIILHLYKKYFKYKCFSQYKISIFVDDLYDEQRFLDWDLSRKNLKKFLIEHKAIIESYEDIIKLVYIYYGIQINRKRIEDIQIIVDKNPVYALHINTVKQIFTNAKYLILIRNPKANISSFKGVTFDFNNPYVLAYRWLMFNECIFRNMNEISHIKIFYEDLIIDDEKELRKIFEFINCSFDINTLRGFYTNKTRKLETAKFDSSANNLRKPLQKDNVDKYLKNFTNEEILKIDLILYSFLIKNKLNVYAPDNFSFKNKTIFKFEKQYYCLVAKLFTWSEILVFKLPFKLRSFIMYLYRRLTKTNLHYR